MLKKLSFALAASAASLAFAMTASAAPLSGWAWSSNIGWVSFNSGDPGAGGVACTSTSGYCVQMATTTTTGTLSGYAWSPNIGWISFQPSDVSGCPSDSGATLINGCIPSVNLTTGAVSGWAKALAADNNGWDGWIELSGTNHQTSDTTGNSGITFNPSTGAFSGYAWGSTNIGWLSFNATAGVNGSGVCVGDGCNGGTTTPSGPTVSCTSANNITANSGQAFTVTSTASSSGGNNGPYTYLWSDGGAYQSSRNFSGITNGGTTAVNYPILVESQDSTGTSTPEQCGLVTVNGTNNPVGGNVPGIWIVNGNNSTSTQTSIRENQSATIGFYIPTGVSCQGNQSNSNGTILSGWGGANNPYTSTSTPTSVTFPSMSLGVYDLSLNPCQDSNGTVTANPASVEIDVTPSSVKEQ